MMEEFCLHLLSFVVKDFINNFSIFLHTVIDNKSEEGSLQIIQFLKILSDKSSGFEFEVNDKFV